MGIALGKIRGLPFSELISSLESHFHQASPDPKALKSLLKEGYEYPENDEDLNHLLTLMAKHHCEDRLVSFLGGPEINALITWLHINPTDDTLQKLLTLPWEKQEISVSASPTIENPIIFLQSLINEFPSQYLSTSDRKGPANALALLVSIEKQATPPLNAVVKDILELDHYIKQLNQPGRYQVIVSNEGHFTAADIYIKASKNGLEKKAIVLDASGDFRGMNTAFVLAKNNVSVFYGSGESKIQRDTFSCPLFAFDHVVQLSKLDSIYTFLEQHKNLKEITPGFNSLDWTDMPYPLVWNAQSMRFLEDYEARQSQAHGTLAQASDKKIFKDYIKQGTVIKNSKSQNYSIEINVRDTILEQAIKAVLPLAIRTAQQMKIKGTLQEQVSPEPNTPLGPQK